MQEIIHHPQTKPLLEATPISLVNLDPFNSISIPAASRGKINATSLKSVESNRHNFMSTDQSYEIDFVENNFPEPKIIRKTVETLDITYLSAR